MRSMAIKVNVSKNEQDSINKILEKSGYKPQRRKYHCTLGFIEKAIPDEEVVPFGEAVVSELQKEVQAHPLLFEVEGVHFLFKHVIAFTPTPSSIKILREMNVWLFEKVRERSRGRWGLTPSTIAEGFTPHMTLMRTHPIDSRFEKIEQAVCSHPSFPLTEAAYVVL